MEILKLIGAIIIGMIALYIAGVAFLFGAFWLLSL